MRSDGEKIRLPVWTILIRPRIICSQAVKSAITPSRSGRIVRMLACSFSYIIFASPPTAIILPLRRSRATTEGSSTTILSSLIMMVLAVPRSIAISWINEKSFIPSFFLTFCCYCVMCPAKSIIWQTTRGWPCRNGCLRQMLFRQTSCALPALSVHPWLPGCRPAWRIRPCSAR